jgi:beta-galactosidase
MGFTGVSFYVDWSLIKGNSGHLLTDGIWSLDKIFNAASQVGLYLIARPGPYIQKPPLAGYLGGFYERKR